MQHNGRRLLYSPQFVRGFAVALREAKADLHKMHFKHLCELADLKKEIGELREVMLLVTSTLRQQAETDVATLRAQLERALMRLAHRDGKPLH
jgi:hypothetical protein